jgi:hypothetical protein
MNQRVDRAGGYVRIGSNVVFAVEYAEHGKLIGSIDQLKSIEQFFRIRIIVPDDADEISAIDQR